MYTKTESGSNSILWSTWQQVVMTEVPDAATAAVKKKISKQKSILLLNVAGEDAIYLASTFGLSDEDVDNYHKLGEAFDNNAVPKRN
ncbi:hypothetical protein PR048_018965 [Dryococelus australis]|uniref:Uncharacterized protein n=1 Tax=Dryococelus australis TaxID=614101 RepID=A0ABQ9H253_9NEOP|nr:hypothetical protein PR048_018965 [Dryococelus australis]